MLRQVALVFLLAVTAYWFLQKKYKFDDRDIYHLEASKEIVKKGNEFIKIKINECTHFSQERP